MNTEQIYGLVNSVTKQAFGTAALTVVDPKGLVDLGANVLSSTNNTEAFLQTLCQRIGRTLYHYRAYRNKLQNIVIESDMEWGAIMQKIDMELPEAVVDDSFDLVDGQSVDPWIISKPRVRQKLYVGRPPFMFKITISRHTLKEAFLSESAMGSFIAFVFGKIRNMIEASYEDLARTALGQAIVNATFFVPLVSNYNALATATLDADSALLDKDFLAYATGQINHYSDLITDLSALYNDGSIETFTPKEDQRLTVLSSFERTLETVLQYQAFHDGYVKLDGYEQINFWQSAKTPGTIQQVKIGESDTTTIQNVVAVLHDRDAVGAYQVDEDVISTPVNARGLYYNTFYHVRKQYFVDTSETMVVFTLN